MTMTQRTNWRMDEVRTIIQALKHKPGALLPVLHAVQDYIGYVPSIVVPVIAEELLVSRAEVHGVISFYHHFRDHQTAHHLVEICRAEACQAVGSRQLEHHAKSCLRTDYHQTTACGGITLEPVYCLGNCATGPSIRIGEKIYGHVDEQRFDELIANCRTQIQEAS